jgi:hypothetical protein
MVRSFICNWLLVGVVGVSAGFAIVEAVKAQMTINTPGVDVWMPKSIDEQDPIEELRPISVEAAQSLQRQINQYEASRPRHVVTATPADIEKATHDWARALVETDMGTSIATGGPIPLHDKIREMFAIHIRFCDLRDRVDELERRNAVLEKLVK